MDEDKEKPLLTCQPCSEKLPMILSSGGAHPVVQVPASISQYLPVYQRDGVRFLYRQFADGKGGILADDMGLGKTIQAIAFMSAILQMKGTKEDQLRHCSNYIRRDIAPGIEVPSVSPVLVVCPATLIENWHDELQIWGYFSVFKITSSNRFEIVEKAKQKDCDVILITFETARSCIDSLNTVHWSCILVDEVHRIKDPSSKIYKALCSFECKLRYGFTGTPFQNNMKELWCLFNWCNPESLGNLSSFNNDISKMLELGQRRDATKRDAADSRLANLKLSAFRRKFMLRRTKDILQLPPKTDQIVFCDLTPVQQNIYSMIVNSPDVQRLLGFWSDKCSRKAGNFKKKAGMLFTYLHLLQKTANHVGLLISGLMPTANETTKDLCTTALEECAGLGGVPKKQWPEILSGVHMSGKMQVLAQMLPVFLGRGDKVLIFSYSTKVLDLVQKHVIKMRYKHSRLDGTTPADVRCGLVRSFNASSDPAIFLLSTKAGGVGLNIASANIVIIYDPNWNPAHDSQAQDRAHRFGQRRSVHVYRLLSTSTIEEFVYLRQLYKQQLASLSVSNKSVRRYFNSVSGDTRYYGELFGIRNLFSFRHGKKSLTEEVIEKQKELETKLRLKLEAPSKDDISGVYVTSTTLRNSRQGVDDPCVMDHKSGLTQLCEDELELFCEDPFEDDTEDWDEFGKRVDDDDDEASDENYGEELLGRRRHNESIGALLERTDAVRCVVQHDKVMAPSKIEDFVGDCAIRDVLQIGINSQLPAFDCSVRTEEQTTKSESKENSVSSSGRSRHKFNQIAKAEFLTPYELAIKVMSMSAKAKETLLEEHQKRRMNVTHADDPCTSKRSKPRTSLELEEIRPVQIAHHSRQVEIDVTLAGTKTFVPSYVQNVTSKRSKPCTSFETDNSRPFKIAHLSAQAITEVAPAETEPLVASNDQKEEDCQINPLLSTSGKSHATAETEDSLITKESSVDSLDIENERTSNCFSDQSEPSSSFERDVALCDPCISKETVKLLENLICGKKKAKKKENDKSSSSNDPPSTSSLLNQKTKANEKNSFANHSSNKSKTSSDPKVSNSPSIDNASSAEDCLSSASALIESIFGNNSSRRKSLPERSCSKAAFSCEASSAFNKLDKSYNSDMTDIKSKSCVSHEALQLDATSKVIGLNDFSESLENILNSTIFKDTRVKLPDYKPEDDIIRQLEKSGKLKRI